MTTKPAKLFRQSGVIAYRLEDGELKVVLVTSSDGRRWTIPKGVVEPGLSPAESAAKEAFEEAGVKGVVHPNSIGVYNYSKWGGTCRVEVFLMKVETVLDAWPEAQDRRREWVSSVEAASRVRQKELAELLQNLQAGLDVFRC